MPERRSPAELRAEIATARAELDASLELLGVEARQAARLGAAALGALVLAAGGLALLRRLRRRG